MFIVYCCFETSRRAIYIHRQRQHNDNGLKMFLLLQHVVVLSHRSAWELGMSM